MLTLELSTRLQMPSCVRSFRDRRLIMGVKDGFVERGTRRTFVGVIEGGSERACMYIVSWFVLLGIELTPRAISCGRCQYTCSRRQYRIRPMPKDGSMTLGVYSRTVSTTVTRSMLIRSLDKTAFPSPFSRLRTEIMVWPFLSRPRDSASREAWSRVPTDSQWVWHLYEISAPVAFC